MNRLNFAGIGMTSQRTRDRLVHRLIEQGVQNILQLKKDIPIKMVLEEGSIESPQYARPLRLHVANYKFRPNNMEDFEVPVRNIQALYNPTNSFYGRGFVQVDAGWKIRREVIHDSSQFHLGLLRHMMKGVFIDRCSGEVAGGSWGKTLVLVTVCREYHPNYTQTPPTIIQTVNPDEDPEVPQNSPTITQAG